VTSTNNNVPAHGKVEVGLALAGGGYRAMLFDLGSLWRINELGWLRKVDMITSVSGGSITNAVLATQWKYLSWLDGVAQNFESIVARRILDFADETIDAWAIGLGLASIGTTIPDRVARAYDRYLFRGATLQDCVPPPVPGETPRFLFYATSLQTGVSVRIERKRLADYRIGEIPNPNLSVAKVVAASSAFPPFLSPSILELDPSLWVKTDGADLFDDVRLRTRMVLTDGGVYDNMGLQALERCSTVLVCDAGAPLDAVATPQRNWLSQALRTMDILTEQTRALRRRMLMEDFGANVTKADAEKTPRKRGVYWRLKTRIGDYGLADALVADSAKTSALQHVRTRLNRFNPQEKGELVNWGYALADAAMRRYVIGSPEPGDDPIRKGNLPMPEWPL
jgi:NTE family protein